MKNKKLETALYLEKFGFSIIALMPNSKKSRGGWKQWQTKKMNEDEIRRHWMKYPNDNIGIVTGKISDLVVYDCDSEEAVKDFEDFLGGKPDTYIVKTSHGAHYYFRYPKGKECRNRAGIIPGLDIRGEGGYVVAAGSIHPDGHRYLEETSIQKAGIAEFPVELFELGKSKVDDSDKTDTGAAFQENTNGFSAALRASGINLSKWAVELLPGVKEGSRNDSLARLTGALFARNISEEETIGLLQIWNRNNMPPLSEKELITTIQSIAKGLEINPEKQMPTLENVEILGVDEEGKTVLFIKDTRVSHLVDLPKLPYNTMIQIAGEEFCEKVSNSGGGKLISYNAWRQDAILQARRNQIGKMQKTGQGIWETKNKGVFLIVNGDSAIIYDRGGFKDHVHPIFEDRFLEFTPKMTWIDSESRTLVERMTEEYAREILDELGELIKQWGFKNPSNYDLIEGFIVARFIQGIWKWRPHMWLSGPAGCGKSKLLELIDALSGPLAITQQGRVTEAAIRQKLQRDLLHVNIDEFEKSHQRENIIELCRKAGRGGNIAKGTQNGRPIDYYIKHMFVVASIEVGLAREAEKTRFIVVEWEKDASRNPRIPSHEKIESLRKRITAVAIWAAFRAVELLSQVDEYAGIEARMLETYAVPLVFRVITEGGGLVEVIEKAHKMIIEKEQERPHMMSDEAKLIEDIALAQVRTSDGLSTVAQLVKDKENDALEGFGIKIIEISGGGCLDVFLAPDVIRRNLLRGTRWEKLEIRDILIRCKGASRHRRRIAGRNVRGIKIPTSVLLGDEPEDNQDF